MRKHTIQEQKIKKVRKLYGKNQKQFAEEISIPYQTLKNIESGSAEIKDLYLRIISLTYNVSYEWLKDDDPETLDDEKAIHFDKDKLFSMRFQSLTKEYQNIILDLMDKFLDIQIDYFKKIHIDNDTM